MAELQVGAANDPGRRTVEAPAVSQSDGRAEVQPACEAGRGPVGG